MKERGRTRRRRQPLGLSVVCGGFGASATVVSHFLLVLRYEQEVRHHYRCGLLSLIAFRPQGLPQHRRYA
jgi:hypothetical protein